MKRKLLISELGVIDNNTKEILTVLNPEYHNMIGLYGCFVDTNNISRNGYLNERADFLLACLQLFCSFLQLNDSIVRIQIKFSTSMLT